MFQGAAVVPGCIPPSNGALQPSSPADLRAEERMTCEATFRTKSENGELRLLLAGVDPAVRGKVATALKKKHVVALHLESRDCNVAVDVLECTRPTAYVKEMLTSENKREVKRESLALAETTLIVGAATLVANKPAIEIETNAYERRWVSWWQDLVDDRVRSRFGPMRESAAPTLYVDELEGADCGRATHWAKTIELGNLHAHVPGAGSTEIAIDRSQCKDPPCVEPITMSLTTFHPRGCPSGQLPDGSCANAPKALQESGSLATLKKLYNPHSCTEGAAASASFNAKPNSEELLQARRLFDSAKWPEAAITAARIVDTGAGADEATRWSAEYLLAVSWARLHHEPEANAILSQIALTKCHPHQADAAFWTTALERRALR